MGCCCELSTANAGVDQTLCDTQVILAATEPEIGCGKWSIVSGGGVFQSSTKYNTLVTNVPEGVNVYKWTIRNCKCRCAGSNSDEVVITINCE